MISHSRTYHPDPWNLPNASAFQQFSGPVGIKAAFDDLNAAVARIENDIRWLKTLLVSPQAVAAACEDSPAATAAETNPQSET